MRFLSLKTIVISVGKLKGVHALYNVVVNLTSFTSDFDVGKK